MLSNDEIKQKIREEMLLRGISQAELEIKLDMPKNLLGTYLNRDSTKTSTLLAILNCFYKIDFKIKPRN